MRVTDDFDEASLFRPFSMRGVTLRNRVLVLPMSLYSSQEGFVDDLHLAHLGRFALAGAGLAMMESTAVTRQGRGTDGCNGIWLDAHVSGLERIVEFLHRHGCAAGIQLGHAGPKGSAQRPWHGGVSLGPRDAVRKKFAWPIVSSSAEPFDLNWDTPHALADTELDALVDDYRLAAQRAARAGFDVLELHCAHGYLLHAFLSPLLNRRTDDYGGGLDNRNVREGPGASRRGCGRVLERWRQACQGAGAVVAFAWLPGAFRRAGAPRSRHRDHCGWNDPDRASG